MTPASDPGAARRRLVELGRVRGAYGVHGWVRVAPHSPLAEVLQSARSWWLVGSAAPRQVQISAIRRQGADLVAKWDGCDSREAAEQLKGTAIAVQRSEFPRLRGRQYYWVDLVGLRVVNRDRRELGVVAGLRSSAAHDLLEIEGTGRPRPILIPVVGEYVEDIDLDAGTIRVNWEPEWLD